MRTQEMAESMTPGKDAMPVEERNLVLQRIAKVAKRQGNWQLAAKKYTQVGGGPCLSRQMQHWMLLHGHVMVNDGGTHDVCCYVHKTVYPCHPSGR
jgi:hypothetical protein